jgi:hypothetical protein
LAWGQLWPTFIVTVSGNLSYQKQRAAVRQYERETGKELNKDQVQQFHREISKQGYSYSELVEVLHALFGSGSGE